MKLRHPRSEALPGALGTTTNPTPASRTLGGRLKAAHSGGLPLAFKLSSLSRNLSSFFRPVCYLLSYSLVPFERFAPCFVFSRSPFRNSLVSLRFAPSFGNSLVSFERLCSVFSSSLVSVEILWSLSEFRAVCACFRKCCSSFRAVCSLFSTFLVILVSFEICLVSFDRFAPCFQILWSLSCDLLLVLSSSTSSGWLLAFKFCSLFRNSLVSSERFASASAILSFLSSGVLLVFNF